MKRDLEILVNQLRITLGKIELALDSIDEAIVWTSEDASIQWCNATFTHLVRSDHCQRIEVIDKNLIDILPLIEQAQAVSRSEHPVLKVLQDRLEKTEYEFQKPDRRLFLEISGSCLQLKGGERTAVMVIRDITERKRAEKLKVENDELQHQNKLANIRQTFGRYVSDEIAEQILTSSKGLKLGGEVRKITILTSDLRGFTATSEKCSPEQIVEILNLYFSKMADVIISYQGTIDEFMGDGILVLFGSITTREDDAARAVACAVAMQLAMKDVNVKMNERGLTPIEMGIGINTGEVVVGNIGSEKRTKYGVVGQQVNLTYRIESYSTGGEILISESTLLEVGSIVKIDGQKQVQPKGVQQPITIYKVGGISGKYNLFLPQEEEVFLPLSEGIPVQYRVINGKQISGKAFEGRLIKLSAKGAEICTDREREDNLPSWLSNLKLNLFSKYYGRIKVSEDIYAKILENPTESGSFYISFTYKPPDAAARLDALYKKLSLTHKS